ncbi:hypothetical protein EZV62_006335 [Acer yangbiense]|uniref:Uncharacterized protein n=1 Tax=Acer yangbiense TaxID=1000413 RepID=A0A5C7IQ32_9ROSI|nr:hypothetical protein EZV62_006335 [Acer yangbiense]
MGKTVKLLGFASVQSPADVKKFVERHTGEGTVCDVVEVGRFEGTRAHAIVEFTTIFLKRQQFIKKPQTTTKPTKLTTKQSKETAPGNPKAKQKQTKQGKPRQHGWKTDIQQTAKTEEKENQKQSYKSPHSTLSPSKAEPLFAILSARGFEALEKCSTVPLKP